MDPKLIDETNNLHALWHQGPPRLQQPPYRHPQPPPYHLQPQPPSYHLQPQPLYCHPVPPHYWQPPQFYWYHPEPPFYRPYPPSTSVYMVPVSNIPASSSDASAKPLQLPPPEITREVDVGGSVEAIVLCPGEEIVKGKANASEVTTDSSCKGGSLLVNKSPSCEGTVNKGDINGSRNVTVPFQGELCKEKGEAEEIDNEGHMEGSMPVTEVSEKKGKAEDIAIEGHMEGSMHVTEVSEEKGMTEEIFNDVNMETSAADMAIPEVEVCKEQSKTEAKAVLKNEDALADASNLVGGNELCLSNVQLLQNEEITREGDVGGSVEAIVLCLGEVCVKGKDIANEGHMDGSMHVTEVSEEKAMTEEIFNDVNMEASAADMVIPEVEVCKEQSKTEAKAVLENEDALADANNLVGGNVLCLSDVQLLQNEEITREGDVGGSVEAIVLCLGEVCVKGKDIANEGHMDGSMHVTKVSEEKGMTEEILNDVNMEASAADMVIPEVEVCKEQSKTEAKAVLENEDALADANNLARGNELCFSDVQLLQDEEITREGDVGGSVEAIVYCPGEVCVKGKENGCEVTTDSSCKGGTLMVKKCRYEEMANKGDNNGSRYVAVPFQGEVFKDKGEAEEIDNEGHMEGSMLVVMEEFEKKGKTEQIVNDVNVEGSIPIGVIFEGEVHKEQGKAEEIFNEVNMQVSAADMVIPEVEVCKEQSKTEARTKYIGVGKSFGKWRARYYNANKKEQMYLGTYETEEAAAAAYDKAALRFKGPTALLNFPERHSNELKLYSIGHKKIVEEVNIEGPKAETAKYEGEVCKEQGKTEGEASKEKDKTEEDVGAGINDSTSNGGRWLLKKCSEKSSGPTPSEPQFVMYDIHSGSQVRQVPRLNPADTQALEQSSPLEEYTEGKEVIKNLVWGNTFFVSKRAAKLLGHILAVGFQYTPSLPDKPAPQPTLPAKRPYFRKPKARA